MTIGSSRGKVPFGLKDGRLHYVTDVPTGIACGCVCPDPACAKPLIARNKPSPTRKRIYHFRHATLTTGCGGRESGMHRMAKELVTRATSLLLPGWSADDLRFEAAQTALAPGSQAEVTVTEGQVRPDVRVTSLVGGMVLPALYVEIKVSHAVDWDKRQKVIAKNLSMIEIDLSNLSDDVLQDEAAFTEEVLHRPDNRHWIHIASPSFLAHMTGAEIVQVTANRSRDKHVKTQKGTTLHLKAQDVLCYRQGADAPDVVEVELADTVKDGRSIDQFDNFLPYDTGLYRRFPAQHTWGYGRDFKTHLKRIVQDHADGIQPSLI